MSYKLTIRYITSEVLTAEVMTVWWNKMCTLLYNHCYNMRLTKSGQNAARVKVNEMK